MTDPTTQHPRPEQRDERLDHPGLERDMRQSPDYGEESYRGSGRLEGRRGLVTGGEFRLRRAIALAFAREGADVVISHLPSEQADADEALAAVHAAGRKGLSVAGDLTDTGFCRDLVTRTVESLGGVDILVNNAAYQMAHEGLEDLGGDEIEHTFRTNIIAMFHLCKAALEHLQPGSA